MARTIHGVPGDGDGRPTAINQFAGAEIVGSVVTTPSRQAACATAASAVRRKEEMALGADKLAAAALARQSNSLLAHQSTVERSWPMTY